MKKPYKANLRGGQFTNKIMAKKRNQLRAREHMQRKIAAERGQQVGKYEGLGKIGLDGG